MGRTDRGGAGTGPLTGEEPGPGPLPRLMLVTDRLATRGRDLAEVVEGAVAGGVGLVQVRERDLPEADVAALLRAAPGRAARLGRAARRQWPSRRWPAPSVWASTCRPPPRPTVPRVAFTGRSVHDEDEARRAGAEGVSYVVAGPIFPTGSKPGHPGAGAALIVRLGRVLPSTPIFAIGGLAPDRVGAVLDAGAHGIAVRSAILGAAEPARAARAFAEALTERAWPT